MFICGSTSFYCVDLLILKAKKRVWVLKVLVTPVRLPALAPRSTQEAGSSWAPPCPQLPDPACQVELSEVLHSPQNTSECDQPGLLLSSEVLREQETCGRPVCLQGKGILKFAKLRSRVVKAGPYTLPDAAPPPPATYPMTSELSKPR